MGADDFIREQAGKSGKEVPRRSDAPADVVSAQIPRPGAGSMKSDMRDVTDRSAQDFNT